MRLVSLLAALPHARLIGDWGDTEITALVTDSRRALPGCLFACLRGAEEDGHAYAAAAYARGARTFLCEYPPALPGDARLIYVPDTALALAALSSAWYGYPERGLTLIGITGTKGKTTVALMLHHLLTACGIPVGYIGSGGVRYPGYEAKTENTTPPALTLRCMFSAMRRAGVRVVVMEVSSQALATARVAGLSFPIAVFTNLAPDHIGVGEHPDFTHYRKTKATLFSDYAARIAVVNADDSATPDMLADTCAHRTVSVSLQPGKAPLYADRLRPTRTGNGFSTAFFLHTETGDSIPVTIPLPGECNVHNALLALASAMEYLGEFEEGAAPSYRTLAAHLGAVKVPGRFFSIPLTLPGVDVLIDYAHNGYSLRAAIAALRAYTPARLVCLFGSVGGRTYSRRTELGEAACGADFCIVTADNPGIEDPADTMAEICRVLEAADRPYVAIPDRREAILYAVRHARPGDLILLCGKGHEDYQLIGMHRLPFCEADIVKEAALSLSF